MGIVSIALYLGIEAELDECYSSFTKRCKCGIQSNNQLSDKFCGKCGGKFFIVDGELTLEAKEYCKLHSLTEDKYFVFINGFFCKKLKDFDFYMQRNILTEIPLNKAAKEIKEYSRQLNLKNKDLSPRLLYIGND
jgi:hypothetical protein